MTSKDGVENRSLLGCASFEHWVKSHDSKTIKETSTHAFLVPSVHRRRVHHRPRRPFNLCLGDTGPILERNVGRDSCQHDPETFGSFLLRRGNRVLLKYTRLGRCLEHVKNIPGTYQEFPLKCVVSPVPKCLIDMLDAKRISIGSQDDRAASLDSGKSHRRFVASTVSCRNYDVISWLSLRTALISNLACTFGVLRHPDLEQCAHSALLAITTIAHRAAAMCLEDASVRRSALNAKTYIEPESATPAAISRTSQRQFADRPNGMDCQTQHAGRGDNTYAPVYAEIIPLKISCPAHWEFS